MGRDVVVAVYDRLKRGVEFTTVEHGSARVLGANIVFADCQDLCNSECVWCCALERTVRSRIAAFLRRDDIAG